MRIDLKTLTSRKLFNYALVALASLPFSLLAANYLRYATSRWGLNFTPDSLHYFAAAESLLDGKGFVNAVGGPYTVWPPLYPLVLAAGRLAGVEMLDWARYANFGLIIVLGPLTALLCYYASRMRLASIMAGAVIVFLPPGFVMFGHAWSDPLFMVLLVTGLLLTALYAEKPSLVTLGVLALVVILASMQRYLGIAFIASTTLTVLLVGEGDRLVRFRRAAIFAAVVALPMAVWMVRNKILVGEWSGGRSAAVFSPMQNLEMFKRAFFAVFYVTPDSVWSRPPGPAIVAEYAWTIAALTLLAIAVLAIGRSLFAALPAERKTALIASGALLFTYSAMVLAASMSSYQEISDRVLGPLAPAWMAVVLGAFGLLGRDRKYALAVSLLFAALLAVALVPYRSSVSAQSKVFREEGVETGFNQAMWHNSPTYRWVLKNTRGQKVYSNVPPLALRMMSDDRIDARRLEWEGEKVAAEPGYYAFFRLYAWKKVNGQDIPPFTSSVEASMVARLRDGAVYELSAAE